jgi:hypothetical protein
MRSVFYFNDMRSFIHYPDFVLRRSTKFYIILDNLEQIILCCVNVHIHIFEIKVLGFILDGFLKSCS